jgi:hypothetical protein
LKRLSFAIENAEMIQENPDSNFAILSLDFFASGDNLHDLYVSEETLLRTANTIKNCPLVWIYDEVLDDIYTHDPAEVPCGFVPESSEVTPKKLEDGRTMLSAIAYVWKRYTGPLLNIFKRDGGKKPVSVEMSVYETGQRDDGQIELLDFRYEGITVLGSYVTPAIPSAMATVLSFEYQEDLEKEFSLTEIIIPSDVKRSVEKGLKLNKEEGGGTSTGIAFAHYLTKNRIITPEKLREINNYFSTHQYNTESVDWLLFGGDYGKDWAEKMTEKLENKIVTFPYKSKADMNPALKGITPPISLAQANAIAAQAESIGTDEEKNGWAIAIASFRDTHHVEDGKWVKNEGSEAKASLYSEEEEDMQDEIFAKDDMGKGEAISVDKSKDALSTSPWGNVDKTALRNKVLSASNYKKLVHDVYIVVESGWEDHPSESLKYPVMQISGGKAVYNRYGLSQALLRARAQGESSVASKISGIYKKLGLEDSGKEEEEAMAWAVEKEEKLKAAAELQKKEEESMTEEEKKKAAEEEAKRFAAEEEAKKLAAEEEAKKEAEAKKAAEAKKFAEEEAKKKAAEEEAKKKAAEEEAKRFSEEKKFQVETMGKFFSDDEDADDVKMAKAEIAKGEDADFGIIMSAIYNKFCNLQEKMAAFEEEKKAYMAENEELKQYKATLEGQQKEFAITETLRELSASVYLPDEVRAEMRADAENYTLETLEAWKNSCKAKSFDYAIRMPDKKGAVTVGLPYSGVTKRKDDLWG